MASTFTALAIDCADPRCLARFWCAVLDYEVQGDDEARRLIDLDAQRVLRPRPSLPLIGLNAELAGVNAGLARLGAGLAGL